MPFVNDEAKREIKKDIGELSASIVKQIAYWYFPRSDSCVLKDDCADFEKWFPDPTKYAIGIAVDSSINNRLSTNV